MNSFFEELWENGEGKAVTGFYFNEPFIGKIRNVRVTYGGGLNVGIDFDEPIVIDGGVRNSAVLGAEEFIPGGEKLGRNLHVYF